MVRVPVSPFDDYHNQVIERACISFIFKLHFVFSVTSDFQARLIEMLNILSTEVKLFLMMVLNILLSSSLDLIHRPGVIRRQRFGNWFHLRLQVKKRTEI